MSSRMSPEAGPGIPAAPIRQGGADDLDGVIDVMNAAFAPCFGERWTRSQCAGILPMSGVKLRLAGNPGEPPIGFSLMRVVADEAELLLIAVAPAAQRRGIGQALFDDFIAEARASGARRLHLEVRAGNAAIAMYEAAGFRAEGRRTNYYHGPGGEQFDAITQVLAD